VLPLADWISHHLEHVPPIDLPGLGWLGLSYHVLSMFVAAGLMLLIFPKVAKDDGLVPGKFRSFWEVLLLFIREEVARPVLHERTDRYVPVLWNFFFFVLFCNLLGLVPIHIPGQVTGLVCATGQIWVTGTLAVTAFLWYELAGVYEQGLIPYVKNIVPPGLPLPLIPLLFLLEIIGHLTKPFALMMRLWANMVGGHAVLYAIIGLVFVSGLKAAGFAVLGGVGIIILEIFVAFLQAYVFTFLVAVFLSGTVAPAH
jgi:F-type H+-transporting ATPase subunit a